MFDLRFQRKINVKKRLVRGINFCKLIINIRKKIITNCKIKIIKKKLNY